eukprot:COSAG01_NODE_53948_length_335_cov_1.538136_1_plen_111_part_11
MLTLIKDPARITRVLTFVLDLIRNDRAELSELELGGAWEVVKTIAMEHANCLPAVQQGAVGLAMEELRTGSPADWVSISRNPCGRFGSALLVISTISAFGHLHLLAEAPGL